jgi:hypothetical protein
MGTRRSVCRALAVLGLAAAAAGCDLTAPLEDLSVIAAVENVIIDVDPAARTLPLVGGRTTAGSGTVHVDLEVDSIAAVQRLGIEPSYLTYAAAPVAAGGPQDAGTAELFLFIGGVPVPGSPVRVTIAGGRIAGVAPSSLDLRAGALDREAVAQALQSISVGTAPALEPWPGMTDAAVRAEIQAALAQPTVPFAIVARATGSLRGGLEVRQFAVDLLVVSSLKR